jgi:hypothetical protein
MKPSSINSPAKSEHNIIFWFHVLITALAWLGPFLFSWWLMATAYGIVTLQFIIFKRCLLNSKHALDDQEDVTFYTYLFERLGLSVNRKRLKLWVRNLIYPILGVFSYVWQEVLEFDPLLFF